VSSGWHFNPVTDVASHRCAGKIFHGDGTAFTEDLFLKVSVLALGRVPPWSNW